MICEPSDSDDEPLDVNLRNAKDGEERYIRWSTNNSQNALGASHQAEMRRNDGIAKNKTRQLHENLSLYKRKRENSTGRAGTEPTADSIFDTMGQVKPATKKKRFRASELKAEASSDSDSSESEITIEKQQSAQVAKPPSKQISSRSRHVPSREPAKIRTPEVADSSYTTDNGAIPEPQRSNITPERQKKLNDREIRAQEQLLKNRIRYREVEAELASLKSDQKRIDGEMEKLQAQKLKNDLLIQQKRRGLDTLDKYNKKLETNGFNTPAKTKNEGIRHSESSCPQRHLGKNVRSNGVQRPIAISSDEENGPIWERIRYPKGQNKDNRKKKTKHEK